MKMDVSKFKKVSSDGKKTVLKHPRGHQIVIAHSAVSPSTIKQLNALPGYADGGEVEGDGGDAEHLQQFGPVRPDPTMLERVNSALSLPGEQEGEAQKQWEQGRAADQAKMAQANPQAGPNLASIQEPAPQQAQSPLAYNNAAGMVGGINAEIAGQQALAGAEGNLGKQQADVASQNQQSISKIQSDWESHANAINQNIDGTINDIKAGHIDPSHYQENRTSGQKVMSAIGLILGGMGAGLTHGPNMAMDFLNKQIDRDIESQRSNLGQKQNLLGAYLHQYGNLRDATDMSRATQLGLTASKLQEVAGKSADPIAKARAQVAIGPLLQQKSQIQQGVAMRQAFFGPQSQMDPATKVRLGTMTGIIPEKDSNEVFKQLQTAENMSKAKDALMSGFDQVRGLNTVGNRVTNPIQSSHQIGAAWEPVLAQLVKDSEGRVTPTDIPMIGAMKPELTDNEQTIQMKRSRLNQFVSEKMNFPMLHAYGITPPQGRYSPQGQKTIQMGTPVKNK